MGKPIAGGLAALVMMVAFVAPARADDVDTAKTLFTRYATLEMAFDPSLADLYSDRATIRVKRYEAGSIRDTSIPIARYKQAIRSSMPVAKAKGDYSTYSAINFYVEGAHVRIKATRYSVLNKYASPITLVVGPENGQWRILEEDSESMK